MKILRIITRLNIGGPAIHTQLLTKESIFKTILVIGKIDKAEGDMQYLKQNVIIIPYLRRELNLFYDMLSIFSLLKIMVRERPDIVHSHTAKAGFIGRTSAFIYNIVFRKKIKVVHTFHGHVFEGYFGRWKTKLFVMIERMLAKVTDKIIVLSSSQKEDICDKYKIAPSSKFEIIRLGFDLQPFFECKKHKGIFRKELGIADDVPLVGIVGRLTPIKNHKLFIDVAKKFIENNKNKKVKFVIVGDGELRKELEEYSKPIKEHIIFCGWRRSMPLIYADLNVLLVTSINEGTPVCIIEAMASSVPIGSTFVGGAKDLIATEPAKNLKEAIGKSKKFVRENYSKEVLIKNIEKLYIKLLEE